MVSRQHDRNARTLLRVLGLPGAVLITVSAVTPAASVVVIAPAAITGAGGGALLSFALGAVLCLGFAACYAEVGSAVPRAGGEYSYAARILGTAPAVAVLVSTFASMVLIITTLASGAGQLVESLVAGADWQLVAAGVILAGVVGGSLRITRSAQVTGTFLLLEVGALVAITALGLGHATRSLSAVLATGPGHPGPGAVTAAGVAAALPTAVFAYNGYASGVFLSEETKAGVGSVARMVFTSLGVVVVLEIVPLAAILLGAPSIPDLASSSSPIGSFLSSRASAPAVSWMSLVIAVAIANAVVAITIQAARLAFVAARDVASSSSIGDALTRVDPTTHAPVRATVVVGLASGLALLVVPQGLLLTLTTTSILVPSSVLSVCALVGRRTGATRHGRYRMPWWPLAPLTTAATTLAIAAVQWQVDPLRVAAPAALFVVVLGVAALVEPRRTGARPSAPGRRMRG